MNPLITHTIETALAPVEHEGVPMIDARSLHGWLGQKQRFNGWIRERLEAYGFQEGEDFYRFSGKTKGRPRIDYLLTLDMAKELAMVERTDIGRVTRRYFIEMEKSARKMGGYLAATGQAESKMPIRAHPWG